MKRFSLLANAVAAVLMFTAFGSARALAAGADRPKLVALDSLNEGIILKSLKEESKGRTVVLVSHSESTMGIADDVYHMDAGRVS